MPPDLAKLGKRYECFKCQTKFYDLNKPTANCPKCGVDQATDPTPDARVAVIAKYKAGGPKPAARFDDDDAEPSDEAFDLDDDDDDDEISDVDDEEEGGGEEEA